MLPFWVSVPKAVPCLVKWAFFKSPQSSCTIGLFFSWALIKLSLKSSLTWEDWGACHSGTHPSHLCPQSPTVTFNLLKAFPGHFTDACLDELPGNKSESQISCGSFSATPWIQAPGKQQASPGDRSGWQTGCSVPRRAKSQTTNACHGIFIGWVWIRWREVSSLQCPPPAEIIHTPLPMKPRQTATNRDGAFCVCTCQPPPGPMLQNW